MTKSPNLVGMETELSVDNVMSINSFKGRHTCTLMLLTLGTLSHQQYSIKFY